MNPLLEQSKFQTRRALLFNGLRGLGGIALGSMLGADGLHAAAEKSSDGFALRGTHFPPKVKRVIYLFFSGGPSHIDTFDYKPAMRKIHGTELPDSIRNGQRITGMTSGQKEFPCVAPMFEFERFGKHGTWVNKNLLPYTSQIVDDITIIKTMNSEAINHDPAITYINTGTQQLGHPSLGAWLSYGLGSLNQNLPGYVVMISKGRGQSQALYSRLWGSGFLPSKHQGVNFRSAGDPVLFLSNPAGIDQATRRKMLDGIAKINQAKFQEVGDPEIHDRISQYEMAYRMQTSVPELMDMADESEKTFELYGPSSKKKGTFAANCILARRLVERGVRYIQLFHRGWDQHGALPQNIRMQCEDTDQPSSALVQDLKQRGMLEDTLVICGGEFGRTIYSQGKLTETDHGRDHHGRCFHTWMAGGGIKAGIEYGETDDYSYNILKDGVHIRDFNATILHQLGIDHERFTHRHLGLDQSLTGVVEKAKVVQGILA